MMVQTTTISTMFLMAAQEDVQPLALRITFPREYIFIYLIMSPMRVVLQIQNTFT